MDKKLDDFRDLKGYLVQKKSKDAERYNAVDSNFLNSNTMYQQLLVRHSKHLEHRANRFIRDYQHAPGVLRRYYKNDRDVQFNKLNDESPYWMQPETVSRDNSMGYVILAGYLGRYDVVRKFSLKLLKRWSFFQNTRTTKWAEKAVPDFCGLSSWSTIVRSCFGKKALYALFPVLLVLDFFYMLSLCFDVLKSYYHAEEVSTCYHVISGIMQKKLTVQTPFSFIGSVIYIRCRKGISGYEGHRLVTCLKQYSRASYDPPIWAVTEKLLNKFYL